MNEVKIKIPDNCELIKDGDTYIVKEKRKKLQKKEPPRSWEEYYNNYPLTAKEHFISSDGIILPISSTHIGNKRDDKNWCTSKEEAEAFLALMQLRQLRKAWVGDWEQPNGRIRISTIAYNINDEKIVVDTGNYWSNMTLSFPTPEMAKDFFSCFRDLCETAKILL